MGWQLPATRSTTLGTADVPTVSSSGRGDQLHQVAQSAELPEARAGRPTRGAAERLGCGIPRPRKGVLINPSMHTRRQTDDGLRACAGPGGTGLRMDCGGDLRWRHHLRRWCKATSSWRALGSTTSSSPLLLKSMHLRSHRTTFQITLKGAAACLLLAPVVFPIGTDAIPVLKPAPSRPHTLLTPDPCAPSRRTHPLREVTHFVGRGR